MATNTMNGDLLNELRSQAERQGKALPSALFQGLVFRSLEKIITDQQCAANTVSGVDKRLVAVEEQHKREGESEKRKWDARKAFTIAGIGWFLTIAGLVVALSK